MTPDQLARVLLGDNADEEQVRSIVDAIAQQRDPMGMRAAQGNEAQIRAGLANAEGMQQRTAATGGLYPHQDPPRFLGIQPRFEGPPLTEHEGDQRNLSMFMTDIAPNLMGAIPGAARMASVPFDAADAMRFRPKIGPLTETPSFGPSDSVMAQFKPSPHMTAGHAGSLGHTGSSWKSGMDLQADILPRSQLAQMSPADLERWAGMTPAPPLQATNSMRRPPSVPPQMSMARGESLASLPPGQSVGLDTQPAWRNQPNPNIRQRMRFDAAERNAVRSRDAEQATRHAAEIGDNDFVSGIGTRADRYRAQTLPSEERHNRVLDEWVHGQMMNRLLGRRR